MTIVLASSAHCRLRGNCARCSFTPWRTWSWQLELLRFQIYNKAYFYTAYTIAQVVSCSAEHHIRQVLFLLKSCSIRAQVLLSYPNPSARALATAISPASRFSYTSLRPFNIYHPRVSALLALDLCKAIVHSGD